MGSDLGWLGGIFLGLLVAAGSVALVFFLLAAKRAHDDVVGDMHDHNEDGPIA